MAASFCLGSEEDEDAGTEPDTVVEVCTTVVRATVTNRATDAADVSRTWRIGFWVPEKKTKKLDFDKFKEIAAKKFNIDLIKISLHDDLESYGHLDAVVHKFSDLLIRAQTYPIDQEAVQQCAKLANYCEKHPKLLFIDPLAPVSDLCDRWRQYSLIGTACRKDNLCSPPFTLLCSTDIDTNVQQLNVAKVDFPIICKPKIAHGSQAHKMCLVFNREGLDGVPMPCVAQTFIPHNATLYKVYIAGEHHFITCRPSLKNFAAGESKTIFFDSQDISKTDSVCDLNRLDERHASALPSEFPPAPDMKVVERIVLDMQESTGLCLFGLDIIVSATDGRYYIIDANVFPSYEGVDGFFEILGRHLVNRLKGASPLAYVHQPLTAAEVIRLYLPVPPNVQPLRPNSTSNFASTDPVFAKQRNDNSSFGSRIRGSWPKQPISAHSCHALPPGPYSRRRPSPVGSGSSLPCRSKSGINIPIWVVKHNSLANIFSPPQFGETSHEGQNDPVFRGKNEVAQCESEARVDGQAAVESNRKPAGGCDEIEYYWGHEDSRRLETCDVVGMGVNEYNCDNDSLETNMQLKSTKFNKAVSNYEAEPTASNGAAGSCQPSLGPNGRDPRVGYRRCNSVATMSVDTVTGTAQSNSLDSSDDNNSGHKNVLSYFDERNETDDTVESNEEAGSVPTSGAEKVAKCMVAESVENINNSKTSNNIVEVTTGDSSWKLQCNGGNSSESGYLTESDCSTTAKINNNKHHHHHHQHRFRRSTTSSISNHHHQRGHKAFMRNIADRATWKATPQSQHITSNKNNNNTSEDTQDGRTSAEYSLCVSDLAALSTTSDSDSSDSFDPRSFGSCRRVPSECPKHNTSRCNNNNNNTKLMFHCSFPLQCACLECPGDTDTATLSGSTSTLEYDCERGASTSPAILTSNPVCQLTWPATREGAKKYYGIPKIFAKTAE